MKPPTGPELVGAIVPHTSMPTGADNLKADPVPSTSERAILGTLADSLWASIVDSMSEGVSVHSTSGEILWANQKLCELYCKSVSELKGLTCGDVFHDDVAACPHEQVLAAGSAARIVGDVCVSGRRLAVTVEPLRDERDALFGFIRVSRDVTSERRTKEQLLKSGRFASLGQLFSGIAHDVGTPLNVISGYAEYLLMRTEPSGQGHKELSAILDQTRRIAAMFGRALDLARPPQGRTDAIEIKALLEELLDLAGHHFRKADVKAGITCRMAPPLIYGEASQLRQAFLNILLNAGQQVGTGGRLQLVIDEGADMPGFLRLSLCGTEGSGIGHDFSRSLAGLIPGENESETAEIGLYLTRTILDAAGATIRAAAGEQGVGLMICLPLNDKSRS